MKSVATNKRGVILLLVLGMLALFSLLTATYVVFTSQSRIASYSISQRNTRAVQPDSMLDQALGAVLVGSDSSASSIWGSGLLQDKYGDDFITGNLRDANAYGSAAGQPGAGQPGWVVQDHFFRVQTNLAPAGTPAEQIRDGVDVDDLLVGRYFTMKEGPLSHLTFRIVRSFRDRRSDTSNEGHLDRILVLDVGPYLDERITHEGRAQALSWWLNAGNGANSLFYGKGADNAWGSGGSSFTVAGTSGSDDEGLPFLINGKERNGFGYGWQNGGSGYNLDQTVTITNGGLSTQVPVALLPNYSAYRSALPAGQADEPFDVPDYRDMFLAHFPRTPSGGPSALGVNAPSFLRPALVNYIVSYYNKTFSSMSQDELKNVLSMLIRSTMRPLPIYNAPEYGGTGSFRFRGFTGGGEGHIAFTKGINYLAPNANDVQDLAIALAVGPWDVDNDGDGVNDSVFIDVGMPLVTMPDGTLVQPMAAYRIEDLSGRVNVNTAGSLATMRIAGLAYTVGNTAAGVSSIFARPPVGAPLGAAITDTQITIVQGGGFRYGPAEIDPRAIHGGSIAIASSDWATILRTRYGHDTNGVPGTGEGAATLNNELSGSLRRSNHPSMHGYGSWWGFPTDVWGRGRVGVDPTGAPLISGLANNVYLTTSATADGNELVNDPYEAHIYRHGSGDSPYTLAEYEPLIRAWDWDRTQLPQRLVQQLDPIVASGVAARDLYRMVTPLSSSDDLLPAQPAAESSTAQLFGQNIYASPTHPARRLIRALGVNPTQAQIQQIIPPEIRLGMKIDLNRLFGNGIDDDGDGVIDDPEELTYAEPNGRDDDSANGVDDAGEDLSREHLYASVPAYEVTGQFTLESTSLPRHQTGQRLNDFNGSRQRLAKDIYCLTMALLYDTTAGQLYDFPGRPAAVSIEDYTAWKVAQWAINVVDFRDGDTIMTRFVYDNRPLDGWDLSNAATTAVVFGMEAPELLLTESLNFHDRRVVDDTTVGGASHNAANDWASMPDNDMDQKRMPQGTSIFELYCPRSPKIGRLPTSGGDQNPLGVTPPDELYDVVNNYEKLNLAAEAPDGNPVFRVAISEEHPGGTYGGGAGSPSPLNRLADPDALATGTFQTSQGGGTLPATQRLHMDAFDSADNITIDRVIWMTSRDPATIAAALPADSNQRNVYYNRFLPGDYANNAPYLQGGQYAVIGPRAVTFVGARTLPTTTNQYTYHSPQRMELTPTQFRFYDFDSGADLVDPTDDPTVNPRYVADVPDRDGAMGPERIRPVVGIQAVANPPATWTVPNLPDIGINISEPTPAGAYYQRPDTATVGATLDAYTTPLDTPFDKLAGRPLTLRPEGQRTGTSLNFRTAFLQRLADPTMPYNADTNPYITIDWLPLDLTVFNGDHPEDIRQDMMGLSRNIDGDDPNPFDDAVVSNAATGTGATGDPILFGSRYKSGLAVNKAGGFNATPSNLIYSVDSVEPAPSTANGGAGVNFSHNIHVDADIMNGGVFDNHSTTLGYLNHCFGTRWEQQNAGQPNMVDWLGVPNQATFPWLPWFNRPFSSPYEVMFVPASAPGRLGVEYILPGNNANGNVPDPFDGSNPVAVLGQYGTLFNFLAYDQGSTPWPSPNFYRLLQWLRTPQPYDSLERMIRPNAINTSAAWPIPGTPGPVNFVNMYASEMFHPPFNWLSPPERHGKINLNTIIAPEVYRSLMLPRVRDAANWATGPFATEFVNTRRGFAAANNPHLPVPAGPEADMLDANLNRDFPTPFAGTFQPAETAHIAPPLHTNGSGAADRMRLTEKQVTLNRESSTSGQRVFERLASAAVPANDPNRHAFFRHDEVTRLANLTTDNSNTFAMWVTVGLFEVDPSTLDVLDEYGADQGANKRFRAFYIIDRSVPVAYEPGRENNAKNTVLFSRILN